MKLRSYWWYAPVMYFVSIFLINFIVNPISLSNAVYDDLPQIFDQTLKAEVVVEGLDRPTSMAFIDDNDFLVLEKDTGKVKRITNGTLSSDVMLDVNVATSNERGMLGIAVDNSRTKNNSTRVFLYYTESIKEDGDDDCPNPTQCEEWNIPTNRLYSYELINNKLMKPKILFNLTASPGSAHNGGAITLGPDGYIYVPVGDISFPSSLASNEIGGLPPDGRGGILRIPPEGVPGGYSGLFGDSFPLNIYYGYGIRNSFGLDFDPISKKLWDTENGPGYGDEINLVEKGYNGGWEAVQGIWRAKGYWGGSIVFEQPKDLVNLNERGNFSFPELTWSRTVGPTALKFISSDKLGKEYEYDMFVSTLIPNGDIYHFDLKENRTKLDLRGALKDLIVHKDDEKGVLFGRNFGGITDMEIGPDGNLYVVSMFQGKIYRIMQK